MDVTQHGEPDISSIHTHHFSSRMIGSQIERLCSSGGGYGMKNEFDLIMIATGRFPHGVHEIGVVAVLPRDEPFPVLDVLDGNRRWGR